MDERRLTDAYFLYSSLLYSEVLRENAGLLKAYDERIGATASDPWVIHTEIDQTIAEHSEAIDLFHLVRWGLRHHCGVPGCVTCASGDGDMKMWRYTCKNGEKEVRELLFHRPLKP